jgi:hypothetical protein
MAEKRKISGKMLEIMLVAFVEAHTQFGRSALSDVAKVSQLIPPEYRLDADLINGMGEVIRRYVDNHFSCSPTGRCYPGSLKREAGELYAYTLSELSTEFEIVEKD